MSRAAAEEDERNCRALLWGPWGLGRPRKAPPPRMYVP